MPDFDLPKNFRFHQIAPGNFPSNRWSDGMIRFITAMPDQHFVLLLEDYWLCRKVDRRCVRYAHGFMKDNPDILRFDLTDDRLYTRGMRDVGAMDMYDIIETPHQSQYQFSTQAGIWNKKLLLKLLRNGKSAWETEIHTQPPQTMRVVGTRQRPVRYANAIHKGKLDPYQLKLIGKKHLAYVTKLIPEKWVVTKVGEKE